MIEVNLVELVFYFVGLLAIFGCLPEDYKYNHIMRLTLRWIANQICEMTVESDNESL